MSGVQVHKEVEKRVRLTKASVRGTGEVGHVPEGWQVSVDCSLINRSWLSSINPLSVPGPAMLHNGTAG